MCHCHAHGTVDTKGFGVSFCSLYLNLNSLNVSSMQKCTKLLGVEYRLCEGREMLFRAVRISVSHSEAAVLV